MQHAAHSTKIKRKLLGWSLIVLPSLVFISFWGLTESVTKLSLPPAYLDDIEARGFALGQKMRAAPGPQKAQAQPLRTGIASADFAISKGDSLAGYLQLRPRRAARSGSVQIGAMAIDSPQGSVVISSLDSVTVSASLRRQVAAMLPPHVRLMTTASHVHSGPGGFGDGLVQRFFMGAPDPALRKRLVSALARVCRQALHNMQRAHIEFGRVAASSLIRPRGLKNTSIDASLDLLKITGDDEKTLGAWIFFAAHPTLIGDRQMPDADYPGVLRKKLTALFNAPVLFAASATGSASARLRDPLLQGQQLAAVVEKMEVNALSSTSPISYQRVRITTPPGVLPLFWGRVLQPFLSAFFLPHSLPIDVLRIGPVVWISLPGELSAELSAALRRQYEQAGLHLIIASHNGAYGGYFMPASRYANGRIEAPLTFYGPMSGQVFVRLLAGLKWGISKNN